MVIELSDEEWKENIFEVIKKISDEEYQMRVWGRGEGKEFDFFDEAMCRLYDDYNFDEFMCELERKGKDQELFRALSGFKRALDRFLENIPQKNDSKEIVRNEEWIQIRKRAKTILDVFGQVTDHN